MRQSVDDVVQSSDVLIIGNKAAEFAGVESTLNDNQLLIESRAPLRQNF
jgi:hypothetical protein